MNTLREKYINSIMSLNYDDDNDDHSCLEFLESLSLQELENLNDEIISHIEGHNSF